MYAGAARDGVQRDVEAGILYVCLYPVLEAVAVYRFLVPVLIEYEEAASSSVDAFPALFQKALFLGGVYLYHYLRAGRQAEGRNDKQGV